MRAMRRMKGEEMGLVFKRDRISAGPPPGWSWEKWAERLGTDVAGARMAHEAARREALEETGLEVFDLKAIFEMEDDGHGYRTVAFSCEYEGEIGSDEAGVVAWVEPEVLFEGSFGEYNRALYNHSFQWSWAASDEVVTRYYHPAAGKDTCVLCKMEVSKKGISMIGEPKKVSSNYEQE